MESSGKICGPGINFSTLLLICNPQPVTRPVMRPQPRSTTEPFPNVAVISQSISPVGQADTVLLAPVLFVSVGLVALGSVLALILLSIIYRRQTRESTITVDTESGHDPLNQTHVKIQPPPLEGSAQAQMFQEKLLLSCPLNGGALAACRCPQAPGAAVLDGGVVMCSSLGRHTIPLPATEMGGTALVTAKTV